MPANPHSSTSRAVGILFASGLLIVFAGLAGLGATAISVASGEDDSQPAPRTAPASARLRDGRGYDEAAGRTVIVRRRFPVDTSARSREGRTFHSDSELPGNSASGRANTAPLAEYDSESR